MIFAHNAPIRNEAAVCTFIIKRTSTKVIKKQQSFVTQATFTKRTSKCTRWATTALAVHKDQVERSGLARTDAWPPVIGRFITLTKSASTQRSFSWSEKSSIASLFFYQHWESSVELRASWTQPAHGNICQLATRIICWACRAYSINAQRSLPTDLLWVYR